MCWIDAAQGKRPFTGSLEHSNQRQKLLCRTRYMLKYRLKPQGKMTKYYTTENYCKASLWNVSPSSLTLLSTDLKVTGYSKSYKHCCLQHAVNVNTSRYYFLFPALYRPKPTLSHYKIWSFHHMYCQYKHYDAYLHDLMDVPEWIAFSVVFLIFFFPRSSLFGMRFITRSSFLHVTIAIN